MSAAAPATATRADPVLAVVRKWEAHNSALPVVLGIGTRDQCQREQYRFDRAVDGLARIERQLARVRPTTTAGAAAALRLLLRATDGDLSLPAAPDVIERVIEFLERDARQ